MQEYVKKINTYTRTHTHTQKYIHTATMSMKAKIDSQSSLGRHHHVVVRKGRSRVITKHHMAVKRSSIPSYSTQSDTLPTAMFQSSQKARFVLEAGCAHRIREMTLAINVSITGGAARLAPVPLWFDRIEFRADGGSNLWQQSTGTCSSPAWLPSTKSAYRPCLRVLT